MALEILPTELRILILKSMPDVQTLHDLIHVSATYRNTYHFSRRSILNQLVREHYGFVGLEEPFMALQSAGLYAEKSANKSSIRDVLNRECIASSIPNKLDPASSLDLLHLHQTFQSLLESFCAHAPCPRGTPSPAEKTRILRALCRLQTYCNIFGAREWSEPAADRSVPPASKRTSSTWYKNFTINEMWQLFFSEMPPWEVEEFGSVWVLMRNEYQRLFDEIRQEFPRTDSRWKALRPASLPLDPWELYPSSHDDPNDYSPYFNHLVLLGPAFLHQVLCQPTREDRWRLLACNAISSKSSFMDTVRVVRDPSPQMYSAEKYMNNDVLQGMRTDPAVDQPNAGWKQHWHGQDVAECVVFTRSSVPVASEAGSTESQDVPLRKFGHCDGWEWGYALWDTGI